MRLLKFTLKTAITLCFISSAITVSAQSEKDSVSMKVELGEVVVGGTTVLQNEKIDAKKIQMYEKEDLSDALNLLPGVLNVEGAKTDMVYVHGFDQRQVPVYYDGVPIYIPYDGYIDLSMLMTSDIAQMTISSGTGSLLYGPNALGGAINVVTAKPQPGFSAKVKVGSFTNGKYSSIASLAYGADKYYLKASYAVVDKKNYRLSDDFEPVTLEDGGNLENSWKKTAQLSLKAGFTPAEGHEYAISYVKHDGKKGIPSYLGTNGSARYWQFPIYDKESVYFLSNSKLTSGLSLKTRLYYDKFDNTLESYDDNTYTTQNKGYTFTSIYDDYSLGGIGTLTFIKDQNTAVFDAQYKYDSHKEHNVGDPVQQMEDKSSSLSFIDSYYLDRITLHGGLSMNYEKGIKAEYLDENDEIAEHPKNDNTVLNSEAGFSYELAENSTIKAGISYKTRFPTMKDRYSLRFGRSITNPDLKAENAMNYTLDYAGYFAGEKLKIEAGIFYSSLKDAILEVYGVNPNNAQIYQLQNTGEAEYYGTDLSLAYAIVKSLVLEANYSFVKRNNITSPDVKFTGVPEHSFHSALTYWFKNKSYLNLNVESYSDRYSTSNGVKCDGFTLLNFKGSYYLYKKMLCLEAGMNNILDKNYEVTEGYPLMGRNWFASLIFTY